MKKKLKLNVANAKIKGLKVENDRLRAQLRRTVARLDRFEDAIRAYIIAREGLNLVIKHDFDDEDEWK